MAKRLCCVLLVLILTSACSLPGTSSLQVFSPIDSFAHDISFSPDGQLLASGTLEDGTKIWRVADKALIYSLGIGDIRATAFSPDGQFIVTGSAGEKSTVNIWSLADGSLVRTLDTSRTSWVHSVDISPDGTQIAVGTSDHVLLFQFSDGSLVHTFDTSGMQVRFSPDGKQLAIAENLPVLRIFDLTTYTELYSLPGHGFGIAYSSDGTLFAAPGWNNQGMTTFQGAENYATTTGGENQVQVWKVADGRHVRAMNTHDGQIHSLAFSPNSQFLISGSNDNTIRLSRVADGSEIGNVKVDRGVDSVAFSPDGTLVAIGIYKTIYLWPVSDLIQVKGR